MGERSIAKWRWVRMHGLACSAKRYAGWRSREARGTELRASAKNKGGPGSGGKEEGEEIALTHRIFIIAKSLSKTITIVKPIELACKENRGRFWR